MNAPEESTFNYAEIQLAVSAPKTLSPEIEDLARRLSLIHGPLRITCENGSLCFCVTSPEYFKSVGIDELFKLRLIIDVNNALNADAMYPGRCNKMAEFYTLDQLLAMPPLAERDYVTEQHLAEYRAAKAQNQVLVAEVGTLFGKNVNTVLVRRDDPDLPPSFRASLIKNKFSSDTQIVAVRLPKVPSHLFAIGTNDQEVLDAVIKLNPRLHHTLVTRWQGYAFCWVHVKGWRPDNIYSDDLLLLSQNALVPIVNVPTPSEAVQNYLLSGNKIATLSFSDLRWSLELDEAFTLSKARADNGELILKDERQGHALNLNTAANFLAVIFGLTYDAVSGFQMHPLHTDILEPVAEKHITNTVLGWLKKVTSEHPGCFTLNELGINHVNRIVAILKKICLVDEVTEEIQLEDYVKGWLKLQQGSTATTQEIYAHYTSFCKSNSLSICPQRCFLKLLSPLIRKSLSLAKSHDVMRPNSDGQKQTARNGFNGLKIRSSADGSDGSGGADAPDGSSVKAENAPQGSGLIER